MRILQFLPILYNRRPCQEEMLNEFSKLHLIITILLRNKLDKIEKLGKTIEKKKKLQMECRIYATLALDALKTDCLCDISLKIWNPIKQWNCIWNKRWNCLKIYRCRYTVLRECIRTLLWTCYLHYRNVIVNTITIAWFGEILKIYTKIITFITIITHIIYLRCGYSCHTLIFY